MAFVLNLNPVSFWDTFYSTPNAKPKNVGGYALDKMKLIEQINYILQEINDLNKFDNNYLVLEETHLDKIINLTRVIDSLRPQNNNYNDKNIINQLIKIPEIRVNQKLLESSYFDDDTGSMIFIDIFIKLRKQLHLRQVNNRLKETQQILEVVAGIIKKNIY